MFTSKKPINNKGFDGGRYKCRVIQRKRQVHETYKKSELNLILTGIIYMTNAENNKKQKKFEETLWDSANKLRGSVEPSEYKHVVLSLIFLKFASDKFEERRQELLNEGHGDYVDMVEFYTMKNVFYLPEEARWSFIKTHAKQNDIAIKIDTALFTVEKNNKSLKGALPDNYFSRLGLDSSKLAALIDTINNINTNNDKEEDIVGRVYEYFLGRFAASEGKGGGEFYTPKCVVKLLTEILEPYSGKIYDPCCGSGGMFVQSLKFIENHQGNKKDVSIYGQEYTNTTYKLAKMNLAIRGISANLGDKSADTFIDDQHKNLKADFILANPPFNQKDWRASDELMDDSRWKGYNIPPTGNANYAWILHMISKLSENGKAGFVLANGSMSTNTAGEGEIRKSLINNDLVDCMISLPGHLFYNMYSPVCLWFLSKNKKLKGHRDRSNEILFIDAMALGEMPERTHRELTDSNIFEISKVYHAWISNSGDYADISGFCKSVNSAEVARKGYNLMPARYVGSEESVNSDVSLKDTLTSIISIVAPLVNESAQRSLNVIHSTSALCGLDRNKINLEYTKDIFNLVNLGELNQKISVYFDEFARAIFNSWFVEFEPVHNKAAGNNTHLPKHIDDLFPSEFESSEFGDIPKGWKIGTYGDVIKPINIKVGALGVPVAEYSATVRGLELRELRFNKQLAKAQSKNKLIRRNDLVFGLSRRVINFGLMTGELGSVSPVYEIFAIDINKYAPILLELYIRQNMKLHMDILKSGAREGAPIDREYFMSKELLIPDFGVQNVFQKIVIGGE
jgi:type I restriction enzyme M protein